MQHTPLLLVHPSYHQGKSIEANLLLSVTENNFMYAITDGDTGEIWVLYANLHCENVKAELQQQFETDAYLKTIFKTVKASVFTDVEMLVPTALYQPNFVEDLPELANYAASLVANQPIADLVPVFSAGTLQDLSEQHAQAIDAFHPVVPMVHSANSDGLYINFSTHSAHFLYLDGGNVVFQNNYAIATADEFNYYLLLVVQLLKINSTATSLFISGIINTGDPMHVVIGKYFSKINFSSASGTTDGILSNFPAHYFNALLALQLCA